MRRRLGTSSLSSLMSAEAPTNLESIMRPALVRAT